MIGENKWGYMNKIRPYTECLSPIVCISWHQVLSNKLTCMCLTWLSQTSRRTREMWPHLCCTLASSLDEVVFSECNFIECAPDNKSMLIKTMHLLLSMHWMTLINLKTNKIHQMYDNMHVLYRRMYILMIDWLMCTMDGQMASIHQGWTKFIHPCNHEWMNFIHWLIVEVISC